MKFDLDSVHFHLSQQNHDYVEGKLRGLDKFKEDIETMRIVITKETEHLHKVTADIHFHWKHHVHLSAEDKLLYSALDHLFHEIEGKCKKEKEKVKNHHKKKENFL